MLSTSRSDQTLSFLPHRLNRQPVVVHGLSADELWACTGISATLGALAGLPLAWLSDSVAMVPTLMLIAVVCGFFFGGGLLRRQKRGRPDTWLYRQLQWLLCQRYPLLARYVGGEGLILHSGAWHTRRSRA
ncbi:TIGR03750 family conjugal transfer protein [Pseudomonas rhodesiae]|uniref:TIGR03750 family conjugal transfer protein n=1 Tax=Pseudomonas rhodesiae TaxID=76760 RepID=UPI00058E597C|nr:TIGR03750 family conjugal transfer protein [Pseudomonas rhodesiae]